MTNIKLYLKNPWTVTIIGGSIAGTLSSLIVDLVKGVNFFSTLYNLIVSTYNWLIIFLNFDLKIWWILIGIIILIGILFLLTNKKSLNDNESSMNFLKYNNDFINNYSWKWSYDYNSISKKYQLGKTFLLCSKCNTKMYESGLAYANYFECPRCQTKTHFNAQNDINNIRRIISDNIERNIHLDKINTN